MAILVDSSKVTFYTPSKVETKAVMDFNPDRSAAPVQTRDKATGLPVWATALEINVGDDVENIKLKQVSNVQQELLPRTEYRLKGDSYLIAVPYVKDPEAKRSQLGISWKLVGELEPVVTVPVLTSRPVSPINKD